MRSFAVICLVPLTLTLSGCHVSLRGLGPAVEGSGSKVTDMRDLKEFREISLSSDATVEVALGDEQSVELELDDNLVDIIETEVRSGRLTIKSNKNYRSNIGILVRITVPKLEAVTVSGSGEVNVQNLEADRFEGRVTGSGEIRVKGTAKHVEAAVTGSGDIDFSDLHAEAVEAKVTGSGDIRVSASNRVKARVTGSGDISYAGHSGAMPKLESKITGSGDVRKR